MAHLPQGDLTPVDEDSFTQHNPWQPPTAAEDASAQRNVAPISNTYATGGRDGDLPTPKVINDNPPSWNGDHPECELEPYLKKLRMWLMSTRTLKTQQGMTIFNHATGDLNVIINELEVEDLIAEESGWGVFKDIQTSYAEYMERKLPQAIEQGIYDKDLVRKRNEGMLQYCIRATSFSSNWPKKGGKFLLLQKGIFCYEMPTSLRRPENLLKCGHLDRMSTRKCRRTSSAWNVRCLGQVDPASWDL